jgi:comEA protein
MDNKRLPVLLWILCAGLWSIVFVDKCGGDDSTVAVTYSDSHAAARYAPSLSDTSSGHSGPDSVGKDSCININRASVAELVALPGIGPAIAGRVVDFREKNGPFARLADIDKVKGIGPATLRKIENRICF